MKYLYKEDFSDFPLAEFPYDHNHSALGEYHTFDLPGYSGNFYDPISLHQWRSKDGSWLVTSDGNQNFMEQNRANEVSGAFNSCYPLLMLKNDIYTPYVLEINTSPGMTDLSDLPAQSKAMGIDYDTLVQIILNGAGLNK